VNQNRTTGRCRTERVAGTGATPGPAVNPWRSTPARRQYASMAQQAASTHWWVRTVSLALDGVVLNKCMVLVPSPMTGTNHARQHPGQCHHPCQITRESRFAPHSARGMTIRCEWAGQVRGRSSAVTSATSTSCPRCRQGVPAETLVAKRQCQVGIAETLGMLLNLAIRIKLYRS
jgi:hypothetical protein